MALTNVSSDIRIQTNVQIDLEASRVEDRRLTDPVNEITTRPNDVEPTRREETVGTSDVETSESTRPPAEVVEASRQETRYRNEALRRNALDNVVPQPPQTGEGRELTATETADYRERGIYTPASDDIAVQPGVSGEPVEKFQTQVRDNLIEQGVSEENASRLLGNYGDNKDGIDGFYGPRTEQAAGIEESLRRYDTAGVELDRDRLNEAVGAEDFNASEFDAGAYVKSWGDRAPGDEIDLGDGQTVTVPELTDADDAGSPVEVAPNRNRRRFEVEQPDLTTVTATNPPAVQRSEAEQARFDEDIANRVGRLQRGLSQDNFDPAEAVRAYGNASPEQVEALHREYEATFDTTASDAIDANRRLDDREKGLLQALADPDRPDATTVDSARATQVAAGLEDALQRGDDARLQELIRTSSPFELRNAASQYRLDGSDLDHDIDRFTSRAGLPGREYNDMLKTLFNEELPGADGRFDDAGVDQEQAEAYRNARRFNDAFSHRQTEAGLVTEFDRQAANELLGGLSAEERSRFAQAYEQTYGVSAAERLPERGVSQQYRDGLATLMAPPRQADPNDAAALVRDANRLHAAFDGRGRNEADINQLILGSDRDYLQQLAKTYEETTGENLRHTISDDSGWFSGFRGDYRGLIEQTLDGAGL